MARSLQKLGPRPAQVDVEVDFGAAGEGHEPIPPPPAVADEERLLAPVGVDRVEPQALATANPGPVEKLQDRPVAPLHERAGGHGDDRTTLGRQAAHGRTENKVALRFVEGLNNRIRVIQRRAYGLRDEEYLRLKILTCMLKAL